MGAVCCERLQVAKQGGFGTGVGDKAGPLHVKPLTEQVGFFGRLGRLNQAQWISRRQPEPIATERKRAEKHLQRACLAVAQDESTLWDRAKGSPYLSLALNPSRESSRKPARCQTVARRTVGVRSQNRKVRAIWWQQQAASRQCGQFMHHLGKGEERKI